MTKKEILKTISSISGWGFAKREIILRELSKLSENELKEFYERKKIAQQVKQAEINYQRYSGRADHWGFVRRDVEEFLEEKGIVIDYDVIPESLGEVRSFAITVGLKEGYGENAVTHSVEEVVKLVEEFLRYRAEMQQPFLTGIVTTGEVVYAWPEEKGAGSGHEPVVMYTGEVTPLYLKSLPDEEIKKFLNRLAYFLGGMLSQERVYIKYRNETWILQRKNAQTPSGD